MCWAWCLTTRTSHIVLCWTAQGVLDCTQGVVMLTGIGFFCLLEGAGMIPPHPLTLTHT